jgi:hypothetical protein
MVLAYIVMALAGVALVVWGLPASHRLKSPLDALAAVAVLMGVVLALLGTLLAVAPRFFQT